MDKKFVFVSVYASPEVSSSEYLSLDIMEQCHKAGFEVVRLKPNPVRGLTKAQAKALKKNEIKNDVYGQSQTFKCFSFHERNFLFRLIRYYSYSRKVRKYVKDHRDEIAGIFLWSYPPIGLNEYVSKCAKRYGIPVVFDVHDVQPEILRSGNPFLNKVISRRVRSIIGNASFIFALSQDMKNTLCSKGGRDEQIKVISPWPYKVSSSQTIQVEIEKAIKGKYVVAYIGNIGSFQNIDKLLQVAALARERHLEYLLFLFVGEGTMSQTVQAAAVQNNNIAYFHKIDEQQAARLYELVDVNVISLNEGIIKYACPSKTPMVLKAKRNILLLVNESFYRHELESCGAYACDPNASETDILNTILKIKDSSQTSLGDLETYQRDCCLNKWFSFFQILNENGTQS